jgi:ferredoxin-NADP reductase
VTFFFQPEVALDFQAGQYLSYTLPHANPDTRGVSRAFTIASAPAEPLLRLTTRVSSQPSTFKQALLGLTPGAALEVSGPHGQFVYPQTNTPVVLNAGGIGITPFRSMLADLAASHVQAATTLLYSNATRDFPLRTFFDALTQDWPQSQLNYTATRPNPEWHGPTGCIDAQFIEQCVSHPGQRQYLVCGPTALVDAMRTTPGEIGVPADQIEHEGFPGYELADAPAARPGR